MSLRCSLIVSSLPQSSHRSKGGTSFLFALSRSHLGAYIHIVLSTVCEALSLEFRLLCRVKTML